MTTAPAVCAALVKLALTLALVCVESQLCSAKNLGLLVGISNYQSPNIRTLHAPPNDLRIMWDALRKRGFAKQDLTVLADAFAAGADAPETMGVPTAANILRALDDLAARVQPGDLVVFYFSGHGTKINQPRARDPSTHVETDGKDEVLLAIDAGTYDYIKRALPGGIVDDVLKEKFDALRSKAFVWAILDACHSGGMTRAAGQSETIIEHFVDGHLLNAPVDDISTQKKEVDPSLQDFARTDNEWVPKSRGGKLVAFMASNTDQFAIERPIPEQQGKPFSVFTYNLVRSLEGRIHGTYAQLAETVALARLAGTSTLPTPVFEGDLNQQLFQGQAQRELLWPARIELPDGQLNVDAGQLQGVRKGTILALISEDKVVGFAEVTKAGLSQSLAMIDPPGRKKLDQKRINGPLLARINTSPVSFVLNVARPPESERGSHPGSEPGFAAIEQLSAEGMRVLPIAWKPFAATEADVRLSVLDGVIYILPSTGEIRRGGKRRSRSVKIEPEIAATAKRLRESLWTVLRQKNLLRIASDMPRTALYDAVDVRIRLLRHTDQFRRVIKREEQECSGDTDSADARTSAEFTIAEASKLVLTHCDQIEVKVTNRWHKDVDVTLLYFDSDYGIYYQSEEDDARVPAGTAHDPKVFRPPVTLATWLKPENEPGDYAAVGAESLLVIIAEAGPTRRTYHYLEQESLHDAREESVTYRNATTSPFDALIREAGLAPRSTRGGLDAAGDATIKVFQWEVVPPGKLAESRVALDP